MSLIKNILALIGLISLALSAYFYYQYQDDLEALKQLDPKAKSFYLTSWNKLKNSNNSAEAVVWKKALEKGVSPEDAAAAMASIAIDENIRSVGILPLSQEVEAKTGKKQRLLTIYQYCNPLIASKMVDYSDALAAYLPCRIAMVEDKQGKVWLYSLNMDFIIYGGKPLPNDLRKDANQVKNVILKIMEAGSTGEF